MCSPVVMAWNAGWHIIQSWEKVLDSFNDNILSVGRVKGCTNKTIENIFQLQHILVRILQDTSLQHPSNPSLLFVTVMYHSYSWISKSPDGPNLQRIQCIVFGGQWKGLIIWHFTIISSISTVLGHVKYCHSSWVSNIGPNFVDISNVFFCLLFHKL